ncbi:Homeodomain-like transcriptional regulator [Perilla frutescens var. hirtella]|uniref:Homeodomain-like transcriptional regulator n=1 Tax=Perilla frutescens var. hirtella TaxID=608512 RepID=A0AAD4PF44_PERFH|nr:Homeodomain-like transcriptional regulator [Perilla frutescens var. hirtella]KAH6810506.1 Homeodomain-like transcriptional regulator [Perilla frutescens var. frutescens]KAH6836622.1 Homeodomain-like transcriptional regulator [Perilla frutescens var. hirtella]
MEILSPTPSSYFSNSSWLLDESRSTRWTPAENKLFENALALFDENTPDRWQRVAAMVPGKTVPDVIRQYKELEDDVSSIEAGLIPVPGYSTSSPFTLEWGSGHGYDGFKQSFAGGGRKAASGRPSEQERKKGVPWTEEEHKLFLMGLKKYGKGDWRNISRNFVITRTPTQVASHAQKYFIRQLSGGKDKRRASIHDITTVNLNEHQTPSPDSKKQPSPDQPSILSPQTNPTTVQKLPYQWNQTSNETIMGFSSLCHGNMFASPPYGMNSYGLKMHGQHLQRGVVHESYMGSQNMVFQMQSELHYPNA